MNCHKSTLKFHTSSSLLLIVGLLIFISCESSRVGPELPTPNPPPPAPQPLILSGFVKDAADGSGISAAIIKVKKNDGVVLSSILSDNSGKYVYDASDISDKSLIVAANKDGYGFDTRVAEINKAANSAIVSDILLVKFQVTSAPVTVATGGQATTPPNTQSISNQPVKVTVPPNAVSTPVTITASSIPAGQLPAPTTSTTAVIQSAGQFGPSGTQFQQPVTISFPLPSAQTVGKTFQLVQLNEQTGLFANSGFTATVNADGTTASAPVTHFTIYALTDNVTLNLPDSTITTDSLTYLELASGSKTLTKIFSNTYSASGTTGNISDTWLKDVIATRLNIDFSTSSTGIGGNMPTLPNTSNYQLNGVQQNPNVKGKGNWVYRWYVQKQSTTFNTGVASGTGWTRNIRILKEKWIYTSATGWYWISHDQGGAISGPY